MTCAICDSPLPSPTAALRGPDRLLGTPGEFSVAVCERCGAGNTGPTVAPEELGAYYPASYGAYGAPPSGIAGAISAAIRRWQAFVGLRTPPLSALREREPARVVDVGCGRGDLAAALIGAAWSASGVELSEEACAVARASTPCARAGTLASVALEPGAYDTAVFNQSLEHLPDPVGDLRRAGEALAPGGLVLVSVPNFDSWQLRRFGSRWFHLDLPRHRVHFGERALREALEHAGFEVIELTTSTTPVGLPGTLQYALFGRCLFPSGIKLRVASGLATLAYPLARLLDALRGGGDVLHAVARKPG